MEFPPTEGKNQAFEPVRFARRYETLPRRQRSSFPRASPGEGSWSYEIDSTTKLPVITGKLAAAGEEPLVYKVLRVGD